MIIFFFSAFLFLCVERQTIRRITQTKKDPPKKTKKEKKPLPRNYDQVATSSFRRMGNRPPPSDRKPPPPPPPSSSYYSPITSEWQNFGAQMAPVPAQAPAMLKPGLPPKVET